MNSFLHGFFSKLSGLTPASAYSTTDHIKAATDAWTGGGGGGGVTDHGALTGLGDDDHTQYHNDTRGDIRYYTKAQVDTALGGKASTAHTHTVSNITDFPTIPANVITFASQSATVTSSPSVRIYNASTISNARMRVGTAPAGSALTVQVQYSTNDGGSWSTVTTLSIAAGSTTEDVESGLSQALAVGNLVRVNCTSAGSAGQVIVDVVMA